MVGPADKEGLEDLSVWVRPDDGARKPTVYIASSLTGKDESGIRSKLLRAAEYVFQECGFEVYSPSCSTEPGSPHYPNEVTAIDHLHAMEADLIFFIGIQPSLGMGIEAHIAADMLIPWCDAKADGQTTKTCPLVSGLVNPSAFRFSFEERNVSQFADRLRALLQGGNVHKLACAIRAGKQIARDVIHDMRLGETLRRQRLLLNMPLQELGSIVDIEPWWIDSIEKEPCLAECLTLQQLMRLMSAVRLRFETPSDTSHNLTLPRLVALDTFDRPILRAATEFCLYSLRRRRPAEPPCEHDEAMLAHWREWLLRSRGIDMSSVPRPTRVRMRKLAGCVAIPLSNVAREEHERLQSVLRGIANVLPQIERETGISIELRGPDFQEHMRHALGPHIYLSTISRLQECDFALIFAKPAATGVGIMMHLFASSTLPCLCVAEGEDDISRMFGGMYSRHIGDSIRYSDTKDVPGALKDVIIRNIESLCESAGSRRPIRDAICEASFRSLAASGPEELRAGYDNLLHSPPEVEFMREEWTNAFFQTPAMLPNTTVLQFVHIANKLGCTISVLPSGVPYLVPPITMDSVHKPIRSLVPDQSGDTEPAQGCGTESHVLFILRHAPHGLPTNVLCAVTHMPDEDLCRVLQPSLDSQVLNVKDGIWTLLKLPATDRLTASTSLIHRTTECLLNCCEFDRDTAFSKGLLKNIPHLCAGGDPMPEDILIRAGLADSDAADVHQRNQGKAAALSFVRRQISRREDLKPLEYARALLIRGRIESDFTAAMKCFEDAIALCTTAMTNERQSDGDWVELRAQATHARAVRSYSRGHSTQEDLQNARRLWQAVGNEFAAAVAKWRCERRLLPERHRRRLEQESPLVRMQVMPVYREKEALAGDHRRRKEIRDDVLEQIIEEVKKQMR